MPVLRHDRQIEAEFFFDLGFFSRINEACRVEQDIDDVAGDQTQHDEDQNRHAEQGQIIRRKRRIM